MLLSVFFLDALRGLTTQPHDDHQTLKSFALQRDASLEALVDDQDCPVALLEVFRGIQSHSVFSTLKHFSLYNQETYRLDELNSAGGPGNRADAIVDERALQEIYTRPFAIAIREAGPGAVMCGFNSVNGSYDCENDHLLNDILKGQLAFDGFVMSDYGATHNTASAILAGLDQEQPGNLTPAVGPGDCLFCGPLIDAARSATVPIARIDDAVQRILRPMFEHGLFDDPPVVEPLPEEEDGRTARAIAEKAIVLLKNDGTLPLATDQLTSIAVIGADADVIVGGGGSGQVKPTYGVSPLAGISLRAGAGKARRSKSTRETCRASR